jgi:hypothetical protein
MQRLKLIKIGEDLDDLLKKQEKGIAANRNEILNNNGVVNNAILTMTLYEGRELKGDDFLGSFNPYIVMILDKEKDISHYKEDTVDPVWNQDYTFSVTSKDSNFRLELYDKNFPKQLDGFVEIPLRDLAHQQKVEEWYNLVKEDNTPHTGAIRLKLHFLWSRYQFFTEGKNYYDNEIKINSEALHIIEEFYNLLQQKFGILYCGDLDKINKLLEDRPHERAIDMTEINPIRKSIFLSPTDKSRKSIRYTLVAGMEKIVKTVVGGNEVKWSNFMFYLMTAIIMFTCVILLERSDFVNVKDKF